jgi:hypothetical protein
MSLGRPAMRAKERRSLTARLASHAVVMNILTNAGMSADSASQVAYDIVITTKRRKRVFYPARYGPKI